MLNNNKKFRSFKSKENIHKKERKNCFPVTFGNSSSITLHSVCGSLLIALSLTDDWRLSTLLKCSVHLYKIASLSVRSVTLHLH